MNAQIVSRILPRGQLGLALFNRKTDAVTVNSAKEIKTRNSRKVPTDMAKRIEPGFEFAVLPDEFYITAIASTEEEAQAKVVREREALFEQVKAKCIEQGWEEIVIQELIRVDTHVHPVQVGDRSSRPDLKDEEYANLAKDLADNPKFFASKIVSMTASPAEAAEGI